MEINPAIFQCSACECIHNGAIGTIPRGWAISADGTALWCDECSLTSPPATSVCEPLRAQPEQAHIDSRPPWPAIRTMIDDRAIRMGIASFAYGVMSRRRPDEQIMRDGRLYLERWWLVRRAAGEIENVYIHRFMDDDGETMHDHPWPNATLVLEGTYGELTPTGMHVRRPGDIVLRRAEDRHAIQSVVPGTLTLFVTGQKSREWGFITPNGWLHHLAEAAVNARDLAEVA